MSGGLKLDHNLRCRIGPEVRNQGYPLDCTLEGGSKRAYFGLFLPYFCLDFALFWAYFGLFRAHKGLNGVGRYPLTFSIDPCQFSLDLPYFCLKMPYFAYFEPFKPISHIFNVFRSVTKNQQPKRHTKSRLCTSKIPKHPRF